MKETRGKNRFTDLAEQSRRQDRYAYTDFLIPAEAAEACRAAAEKERRVFGGAEGCERVMVRFGDPAVIGYEEPYPIAVLEIRPQNPKFAEPLTHRDYLGALMHAGLERDVFGDVLVRESGAYVFVEAHLAEYLCGELRQVRHTAVRCSVPEEVPEDARPQVREETITATSVRLDTMIARVFHLSRTRAKALFAAGSVLTGGLVCGKESHVPVCGEVVSVRGFGKFRYAGEAGTTRKGSLILKIETYT